MKVSEFIGHARDELFKGWTQGAYRTNKGQVCAVGALERVAMQNLSEVATAGKAQEAINAKAKEVYGVHRVQSINDRSTTGQQDMLDLFDKTMIGLEERGE